MNTNIQHIQQEIIPNAEKIVLDFIPEQQCTACQGTGVMVGTPQEITITMRTNETITPVQTIPVVQQQYTTTTTTINQGYTTGLSGLQNLPQSGVGITGLTGQQNFQSGLGSRQQLGFTPRKECTSCIGTGYQTGTNNLCVLCPTYSTQQSGIGLKEKLGFMPRNDCTSCLGTGYQTGTKNLCVICPTYSTQKSGLGSKQKLGFTPRKECTSCLGTGYQTGTSNLCVICPTYKEGSLQTGNLGQSQSLKNQLNFVPNPKCTSCIGTGYQTGTNNLCVLCPTASIMPTMGQSLNNNTLGQSFNNSNLGFTPQADCKKCHGTGYYKSRLFGKQKACSICSKIKNSATGRSRTSKDYGTTSTL
jgi:DnaJ-class molecular chaperone